MPGWGSILWARDASWRSRNSRPKPRRPRRAALQTDDKLSKLRSTAGAGVGCLSSVDAPYSSEVVPACWGRASAVACPSSRWAQTSAQSRLYGPLGPSQESVFRYPPRTSGINPAFLRTRVAYAGSEKPGTIVIDPGARYLYFVEEGGHAIRYGVGVGKEGFAWSGTATIHDKQEWPDWYPPKEMIQRRPDLRGQLSELQSGLGVPGGPSNPLGARAMYLWQGNKDTLYRIHGTNEPWTIGTNVSSGCIRLTNQDAIDLYDRTAVGAKVVVLRPGASAAIG